MKKLILSFNLLLLSSMLFSTSSVHGMENHEQLSLSTEKYNQNHPLCLLPKDVLLYIFSYHVEEYQHYRHYDCDRRRSLDQVDALEDTIYNFIQLSDICKKFKNLLTIETIGSFCKHYDLNHKNRAVKNLLKIFITATPDKYDSFCCYNENRRLFALILICAGADPNIIYEESRQKKSLFLPEEPLYIQSPSLLECATCQSDAQLAKILFEHHADPNTRKLIEYLDDKEYTQPVFFYAKITEIAQMFIDNDVNLHAVGNRYGTNVLWETIKNNYPSSLMEIYLTYNINAKQLNEDASCLLHRLANPPEIITNIDNFLQKCNLLLDAIPDMINTLNKHKETPLDYAKSSLKSTKTTSEAEALEKLIKLLKKRGGLTSKALRKRKKTTNILHAISHNNFRKK